MPLPAHNSPALSHLQQAPNAHPVHRGGVVARVKALSLALLVTLKPTLIELGGVAVAGLIDRMPSHQDSDIRQEMCRVLSKLFDLAPFRPEVIVVTLGSNPNPDGVEILIVDTPAALNGGHQDWVSFVANGHINPCDNIETLLLKEGLSEDWCAVLDQFKAIAKMENPPEIISMSQAYSPASEVEGWLSSMYEQLAEKHGNDSSKWPAKDQQFYRQSIHLFLKAEISQHQSLMNSACGSTQGKFSDELLDVYGLLVNSGVTLVLAAGNQGFVDDKLSRLGVEIPDGLHDSYFYLDGRKLPDGVIVVGASEVDKGGALTAAEYSSPHPAVDVAANGKNVLVDRRGKTGHGTSMAVPQVAALAANMLAINPRLSPAKIEEIITLSATPVSGQEGRLGAGVINPDKAYELARLAS